MDDKLKIEIEELITTQIKEKILKEILVDLSENNLMKNIKEFEIIFNSFLDNVYINQIKERITFYNEKISEIEEARNKINYLSEDFKAELGQIVETKIDALNEKFLELDTQQMSFEGKIDENVKNLMETLSSLENFVNEEFIDLLNDTNYREKFVHKRYMLSEEFEDSENNWEEEISRFGSVNEEIEDLKNQVLSLQNSLKSGNLSYDDDYKFLDDHYSTIAEKVNSLSNKLDEVDEKNRKNYETPKEFKAILERVNKCKSKYVNVNIELLDLHQLDIIALQKSLEKENYYISNQKLLEIIRKLKTNYIVVLEGIPGSGKTKLARLLCEKLINKPFSKSKYTFSTVDPDWTKYTSLGTCQWINGRMGPFIGKISESIIKCIENDGNHWLILDEFNRGDIAAYLGPFANSLSLDLGSSGQLELDEIYGLTGYLEIPMSYRILCTMNSFDKNRLFQIPDNFNRRIGFVEIAGVDLESLNKFIKLAEVFALEKLKFDKKDLVLLHNYVAFLETQISKIISKLLFFSSHGQNFRFANYSISSGVLLKILNYIYTEFISHIKKNKILDDQLLMEIIDSAFSDIYIAIIPKDNLFSIEKLIEIFDEEYYSKSFHKLKLVLSKIKIY